MYVYDPEQGWHDDGQPDPSNTPSVPNPYANAPPPTGGGNLPPTPAATPLPPTPGYNTDGTPSTPATPTTPAQPSTPTQPPTYTPPPNPADSPLYPTYRPATYTPPSQGSWADANPYQDRNNNLYEMLMGRAQQGLNISRSDPIIRAQADAFSANAERSSRNYISDTAEKMGPLANIQGERRMAAERTGQATGAFEAQLMGRELEARRNEIQMALTQMGNMLSDDQRLALQRELGLLENAMSKYGLDIQQSLGVRSGDIGLYNALMGNQQFYSQLGLDAANDFSYWNDPMRETASRYR